MPVPRALATMAVPTIISQLINLIYNMVDAFYIGRTGNSYMMAATTVSFTIMMLNISFANLFGIGGGSLVARLMGKDRYDEGKKVSAFAFYCSIGISIIYSTVIFVFMTPILNFLGASDATIVYATQYTTFVVVLGTLPMVLSLALAQLLRNTGNSTHASIGLSMGGVLNIILDPIFMFVIMDKGEEVKGAAIATLISNTIGCIFLLVGYIRAGKKGSPLSMSFKEMMGINPQNVKEVFAVGIPSAILTGLFDVGNVCMNILASAHNDMVLAATGIVMKIERIPNAINIGLCQGMLPLVAYNYSSGNKERLKKIISNGRLYGLIVSFVSIVLLEIVANPITNFFLDTTTENAEIAMITVTYAALFLRIRCLAAPVQFMNYHSSYCLQGMGRGKDTMIHAFLRILVFYIPLMFVLDKLFAEYGLMAALPAGEGLGAIIALILLSRVIKKIKDNSIEKTI